LKTYATYHEPRKNNSKVNNSGGGGENILAIALTNNISEEK
jgi:hypothetical protein